MNVPVVMRTTSDEERGGVEASGLHVAGYLVKPVRFVDFVELMTTLKYYRAARATEAAGGGSRRCGT